MVEDSCEEAGCCSDTPPHHVAAAILSILQDLEQIHTHVSKMDDLCVNSAQKKWCTQSWNLPAHMTSLKICCEALKVFGFFF